MSKQKSIPIYIADTHSFYWYLQQPSLLSPAADAVFRLVETNSAQMVIPAIVIAEIYYLTKKKGKPLTPSRLLAQIEQAPGYLLSELGVPQLERLEELDIPEMHDRLIVAEAIIYQAPIVTKDAEISKIAKIETIW